MNFLLDMKTIFLTLVVGHIFTVILISAYWHNHKKDKTFNLFFTAKCFQALAWFFLILKGGIPDVFTISLANSLLFLGSSLDTVAILKLIKSFNKRTKRIYVLITIINIVGFHLILFFHNVENLRIAFASFGTAAVIIIPAYRLLLDQAATRLKKIMGTFYLILIISMIGRGIGALSNHSIGIFTPGLTQTFAFLSLYLIMIVGNMGFILLLKERTDQELVRLASFDDLTNTMNRRTFISHAEVSLKSCVKQKEPLSFVLFDVDHFKQINDTFGHVIGDHVLQDLSNQISRKLEPDHLFGRYGGDEFAILLPMMDERTSEAFAERLRKQISKGTFIKGFSLNYTLSIGVTTVFPNQDTKIDSLYVASDKALYEAKHNGRNCVFHGQLNNSVIVG